MATLLTFLLLILLQLSCLSYFKTVVTKYKKGAFSTQRLAAEADIIDIDVSLSRRRIRYPGKYPKNFDEKYKEMRGDVETIERVLERGQTPAGQHLPIMVEQCISHLGAANCTKPGSIFVDCTLGYGGHTSEMLKMIVPNGRVIGLDQDNTTLPMTAKRIVDLITNLSITGNPEDYFTFYHRNFGDIEALMKDIEIGGKVNGLIADLGFSSMQIDNPIRGFSYKALGPLDMRMDTLKGQSAHELLRNMTLSRLVKVLRENSDEVYAYPVAAAILGKNSNGPPDSTIEFSERVRTAVRNEKIKTREPPLSKSEEDSCVARAMQAVRIEVNDEFGALERLLATLPALLAPGGRAVFLTFHSGEDRRVKKALKAGFKSGIYSSWSSDVERASSEERRRNPRSKCAKLRFALK